MRHTFLVCYDIANDKRRDQVFKICKNYGARVQFSVFECDLNPSELISLQQEVSDEISCLEDQVLFVMLGPAETRGERVISALGRPYTKLDAPCYIV